MTTKTTVLRAALQGVVKRMKTKMISGKPRDEAAANYLCGAIDVARAFGIDITVDVEAIQTGGYMAVLETLADLPEGGEPAPAVNEPETTED